MTSTIQFVFSAHAVMKIEQVLGIDLATRYPPAFSFPDGSLHYSDPYVCEQLNLELGTSGVRAHLAFAPGKSISLFPPAFRFSLVYTAEYQKALGEEDIFGAGCADLPEPHEGERCNPVQVVVEFKRKPPRTTIGRYLEYLRTWATSVHARGVGGEGPAVLASSDLSLSQRWVWFEIDASGSGPHTLNWLTLVHMNFGVDVTPIRSVFFNPPDEWDPRVVRPLLNEAVRISVSDRIESKSAVEAEPENRTPEKRLFRWGFGGVIAMQTPYDVQFASDFSWQDQELEISIHFNDSLAMSECNQLLEILQSWLRLAYWGAFGGSGIPGYETPRVSDDARTVTLRANLRDAQLEPALLPLFNALIAFHNVAPIELVCLGD